MRLYLKLQSSSYSSVLFYRHLATKRKKTSHNETEKKIHPSIGPSASLYVRFLLFIIAPVDPSTLSFSLVFTPPVLIPSFLPTPSFISHLSVKLLQDSVWAAEERWGWRKAALTQLERQWTIYIYVLLCPNELVIPNLMLSQLCFIYLICCSKEDLWCGQWLTETY